jgi:hypothetical protein
VVRFWREAKHVDMLRARVAHLVGLRAYGQVRDA